MGFLLFALLAAVIAQPDAMAGAACYQHQLLNDLPDEGVLLWSQETQGVTHDADYWYIVQNWSASAFHCNGTVWRIPIGHNLSDPAFCGVDDVSCAEMSDEICDNGYNHAGDPAYHAYDGVGYIIVPLEKGDPGPAVAVYRADSSLAELGWMSLAPVQTSASWCAVGPDGFLYMGNHFETWVNRYFVNWERLTHGDGGLQIDFVSKVPLQDESGNPLSLVSWEQGGAFSEGARLPFPLLYLINGDMDASCDCGIHVFEVRESETGEECPPDTVPCLVARRVERSTNGYGAFSYEYHPEDNSEEPEGLTFWDLDADARAPGVSGQLHAVMLDNEAYDAVYIKHYRLETDNVPPVITCPADATVECTGNNGIEADDPQLEPFFSGASATDECDEAPDITNNSPPFLPLGDHEIDFTAEDYFRNPSSCSASVLVQDTHDPIITVTLDRTELWPPNHKMVPINASVTVTDVCDPNPTFVLTSITSDEPDNGLGDGDTSNDIQGGAPNTPDVAFEVRSERAGVGDGRVYTIIYTGIDGSGNSSLAIATVVVPHDQAGLAKSGEGFNKRGTDWLQQAATFDLVAPSSAAFDARLIARRTAQIGGGGGVLNPLQTQLRDVTGDGLIDVVARFNATEARRLRENSGGESLAFRYETTAGVGYLVPDIFALGSPVDSRKPTGATTRDGRRRGGVPETIPTSRAPKPALVQ